MDEKECGVAWDDRYKLGNEQVDSQHKKLFELVNELVCLCAEGRDTEELKNTLDFLVDYTVRHFYDEESLQVQYNYPEYRRHKQLHDDFKITVGDLVKRFHENGSSTELSSEVNSIIVRWLINHILSEDKKIGEYIRKVESRY